MVAATMDDGVGWTLDGISMMAGSAGVFKLNPRDSVMATTNPIQVNDIRTGFPHLWVVEQMYRYHQKW